MEKYLSIEWVKTETVKPYEKNPRKNDKAVNGVAASIQEFGFRQPIVVDGGMVIIAGHTRWKAARKLGLKTVPVHVARDLSPEKVAALRLADNKTAELAEWDFDLLGEELKKITEIDMSVFGFEPPEMEGLTEEDAIPVAPEPVCKTGDLWRLGDHRLLCGDSTVAADVERLMGGEKAGCILTDPPYGIGYEYETHDDSDNEKNAQLVSESFRNGPEVKIWTPGLRNVSRDIFRFGKVKICIWFKRFAMAGNGLGGASVFEPIFITGNPSKMKLKTDVIECSTDRQFLDGKSLRDLHPCPKPVELFSVLMESLTENRELIYDPFLGSGTTLIAAEKLGRRCFGMEIAPCYCDVIIKRWENFTGKKEELVQG